MSRAGAPWQTVASLHSQIERHPPEGAYTHFHSADTDAASVVEQKRRFRGALETLPARPSILHAENSPAIERGARSELDLAWIPTQAYRDRSRLWAHMKQHGIDSLEA